MEENKDLEEWKKGFEGLTFQESARRIRDKILESSELDSDSKRYFSECFNYVEELQTKGKHLDSNLLKIHMEMNGFKGEPKMEQFVRTLMLLSLCGYNFDFQGHD
jgi:hypothetical protein